MVRLIGLLAGPILGVAAGAAASGTLDWKAVIVLGLLVWMACWWLTLAVDLAVTALLPVLILPITGVDTFATAARPYASDVLFLFGGGIILSIALEQYGLSRRFAGMTVRLAGTSASAVVAALMVTTAVISAFVSNTATVATMLPIALAAARAVPPDLPHAARHRVGTACFLGIAYAATIGGVCTVIGSPPNAIAAKYIAQETGRPVTFTAWMAIGVPIAALLLPTTWFLLTRIAFPVTGVRLDAGALESHRADIPPAPDGLRHGSTPTPGQQLAVLAIFLLTAGGWLSRPLWGHWAPVVGDSHVAVLGAMLLLTWPARLFPYRPLLTWRDLWSMPWSVLILFGGGLSLAAAIDSHGVAAWLGTGAEGLSAVPLVVATLVIVGVTCFASELASNTALAATALPIVGAIALAMGVPVERLAVPTALGASLAFMLPVGTPPNAMVYASGLVRSQDMAKAGFALNLLAIALVTLACALLPTV